MSRRNPLEELWQEIAGEMGALRREVEETRAVPVGYERLNARDRARRVFGPNGMSPQERARERERIGLASMLDLARTYRRYFGQAPRGLTPLMPSGGR